MPLEPADAYRPELQINGNVQFATVDNTATRRNQGVHDNPRHRVFGCTARRCQRIWVRSAKKPLVAVLAVGKLPVPPPRDAARKAALAAAMAAFRPWHRA